MTPTKIGGVNYTPQNISTLCDDVIFYRDRFSGVEHLGVTMSHVITLLTYLSDLMAMEFDHIEPIGVATLGETENGE